MFKKFIDFIRDENRDVRERFYVIFTSIGLIALFGAAVTGLILGESPRDMLALAGALVLFSVIFLYSIRKNCIRRATNLMAFIIVFIVLPVTFFFGGGVSSGMPLWFVFVALLINMLLTGVAKVFFMVSLILVAVICYVTDMLRPDLVVNHQGLNAYADSFVSYLIISLIMILMISCQISMFRSENRRAEARRARVQALNDRQNQFFSSMSHEIRTPINTIIGLNEMILKEEISEEVADDAVNMQAAGRKLLALINDILDMSKIESGKMEITPVRYYTGDMLSDIVSDIWIRAREKDLEFHVEVDPMLPAELIGDEVRIRQILINVLQNAVKYTAQGSVTLAMRAEKGQGNEVTVIYSVTDTGIGIKKENMPYLFATFRRVDDERSAHLQGTGLGLSIVKRFVELMNGTIKVNSVYTQGTSFYIEIPQQIVNNAVIGAVDMEKRHALNRRTHYKRIFKAPKARILAVDDTAANLMVLKKLLRDTGIRVDTAGSGQAALELTCKQHYDLIFMDHMMPGMDGIACLHAIRSQESGQCLHTKVVALTANDDSTSKSIYRREGFDGYLVKPIDTSELGNLLIELLPEELVEVTETDVEAIEEKVAHREVVSKIPVIITTESVCDLPREMIAEANITVIPYNVCTDGGVFLDGIETDSQEMMAYITANRGKACSEPPDMERYEAFFADELRRAEHVIHISMAKHVGTGYHRACEAAESFDNVTVVDSGHLSSGMGMIALAAAQLASEGKTASEILEVLPEIIMSVRSSFIVESGDYLARVGRLNKSFASLVRIFMLRPVLTLGHSRMGVGHVYIGARNKAWRRYIASALGGFEEIDRELLFITHVGLTTDELREIEAEIRKRTIFRKVIFQRASGAVAANCGPGTFGLLFRTVKG